jgi:hypothetical protein
MLVYLTIISFFIATAFAQGPAIACTSTITAKRSCCVASMQHTATQTIDCFGCVLSTTLVGPQCRMICAEPKTLASTTTIIECAAPAAITEKPVPL